MNQEDRPLLIVVAGPNGSGKTTITEKLLRHEWMDGCVYVNPDQIAQEEFDVPIRKIIDRYYKSLANCVSVLPIVDRAYFYDNSVPDCDARLMFRLHSGAVHKLYGPIAPWAEDVVGG